MLASQSLIVKKQKLLGTAALCTALSCGAQSVVFDETFSLDGSLTMNLGSSAGVPKSLVLQPDGRILLAGTTTPAGQHRTISIVRLNADGSLDTSFDLDGKVEINTMPLNLVEWYDEAGYAALQPDGKLVLAGNAGPGFTGHDYLIMRVNADGSIDEGFGDAGWTTTDVEDVHNVAQGMTVLPDGKILVLGEGAIDDNRHVLLRYDQNGILDSTFGTGGMVMSPPTSFIRESYAMTVDDNGMIIVAASERTSGISDYYLSLYRYTSEGQLDSSFDGDGIWLCPRPSANIVQVKALWIDGEGKYCSAGRATYDSLMTVRVDPGGSLDPTYGIGGVGMFRPDFFLAESAIQDVDGSMIVVGSSFSNAALMRLTADGDLDVDFGDGGVAVQNPIGAMLQGNYMLMRVDAGQRWVLAGRCPVSGLGDQTAVVRFMGNDATFIPRYGPPQGLRIRPNPATSEIRIKAGVTGWGPSDIRIFSSDGAIASARIIPEATPDLESDDLKLDVSTLPAGLYTVVARHGEHHLVGRVAVVPR